MKFYQVEKDVWTILVYAKNNEESPILDFLFDDRDYFNEKTKMLTLFKYISTHGPGKNEDISKHLQGNILEFKRGPKKAPR